MSETKTQITQGEWKILEAGEGYRITNAGHYVASIAKMPGWAEEAEANAKLIAAAPDLLKALKEMLRHTDGNCAEAPTTTFSKAERNARAAIEKATL